MKKACKNILSALLCAVLLCGSALAFDLEAFWAQNGAALEGKGVFRYGVHEFQDGLMPVLVRNDWGYELADGWVPDTVWNYINESLEVVDLNKGRFSYVFPFFDGLAAVIGDDGVGYIDTTGTLVIPCSFGAYDSMGVVYTGYFRDGTAPVLKEAVSVDPMGGSVPSFQVGRIDKSGALVQAYTPVDTLSDLSFVSDMGDRLDADADLPAPQATRNQSSYATTSFELVNPTGAFDSIASYYRVNYKLQNNTATADQVDIAVIPCVRGGDFDLDGRLGLQADRYYPAHRGHAAAGRDGEGLLPASVGTPCRHAQIRCRQARRGRHGAAGAKRHRRVEPEQRLPPLRPHPGRKRAGQQLCPSIFCRLSEIKGGATT